MKSLTKILLFGLFISGCSNNIADKGTCYELEIQKKCTAIILKAMFDPDSYKSLNWEIWNISRKSYNDLKIRFPDYDYKYWNNLYIHKYRGKNKMGGYVPGYSYFLVDSVGNVEMSEKYSLPSYINRDNVPELR